MSMINIACTHFHLVLIAYILLNRVIFSQCLTTTQAYTLHVVKYDAFQVDIHRSVAYIRVEHT